MSLHDEVCIWTTGMRKLSIGLRLTLWYLAIFALAQIIFGGGMWFLLRHHLYDLVDDSLEAQVEDLSAFLQAQKKDASIAKLKEEVTEEYDLEHSGDYLQIYLGHGEWMYQSAFLREHPVALSEPETIDRPVFQNHRFHGRRFRFITQRVEINGVVLLAQTGAPLGDVLETLSQFRMYLLMFAPLVLLLAAAGGYWLSRRALSPVDSLVRSARAVTGANLSSRLQKLNTGDELQRLSDTLNEMLDRIESAFRRVTQFTADASHELRTPVSLIRTDAELALRRSRGESEYKESLRHILLEAERTTTLIEGLLSLARADSGRETLDMHPINLRATLLTSTDAWRQVATIRNLQFENEIPAQDLFVMGDEAALHRLLDILLDNAFKYTPSPGTVRLSFEQKDKNAVILVRDSGVGIPVEEQSKIFERFYRVDKARSREQGGAGLGLSIAQWVVAQHAGSIEVESCLGEGSTFRVSLPLAVAPVSTPLLA
jgi:two-component system, OmpR family, heavy metal sensor histidine kinase CusS